ncbi:MAG: Flp pilus assembly protein CpaB [Dehalococcoidia bacterium]|nr:Flp pilus assembly protein CpaB [Dehalococcoidia bacterium]
MAGSMNKITRGSGRGLLLLALLFAAVAAILAFVALNRGSDNKDEASAADTKTVVVAARDIPARTDLESEMLKTIDVPVDSVLSDTYSDPSALVGQTTRYPLVENEQVTALKIGVTEDVKDQGLSSVLPTGMRAFSITISEESSVGGLVLPGDLVDIIAIFDSGLVGVDKAVTLLQNVEVLAIAQTAQEAIPPAAETTPDGQAATPVASGTLGERPEDVKPNPSARTVTLAVTQDQAQLLALVQAQGDLALSLRSFGDRATGTPAETDLTQYGAVRKTPSP